MACAITAIRVGSCSPPRAVLLEDYSFRIVQTQPRIVIHPAKAMLLAQIRVFAQRLGKDSQQAIQEARAL
ncbi:MAG: hypothetical protein ACK6AD_12305 [Cyanobacteriota bacterium]|jgi:hypothetical protein